MELKRIKLSELKPSIALAFSDDAELLKEFHFLAGKTLEECVDDTYNKIIESSNAMPTKAWNILADDKLVGYCVIVKAPMPLLYSFGINIHSRTKEVLVSWMKAVDKISNGEITTVLYSKNVRAIEFMKKNKMEEVVRDDEIVVLKTKNK
jgi:hypothetical protein